jgi:hypothetical protein
MEYVSFFLNNGEPPSKPKKNCPIAISTVKGR